MADEYEILPSDELNHLRHEVEKLKRNPLGDTQSSIELLRSINTLNENIGKLTAIFQSANDDLQQAFGDTHVQEQLQRLRAENAKIAHGIVALSELVKGVEKKVGRLPDPEAAFAKPKASPQMPAVPPRMPQIDIPQQLDDDPVEFHEDELTSDLQPQEQHEDMPQMPNPFEIPGQGRRPQPIITGDLPHPGEPAPPPPPQRR